MSFTYSIGIDVGGTNTDIGLVRSDGVCVGRRNLPTSKYFDAGIYVADIMQQIDLLMKEFDVQAVDGIGIGAPNANFYTGCMEHTPNLNFKGIVDFKSLMQKYMEVPVVVSNDANAAAYGELVYGGAKGMKHFIMFTLGTGVGSGIVIDGKLVHGFTGSAGELGHTIVVPEGRQCNCGLKGCLETYCSATGIRRTALELLDEHFDDSSMLAKAGRDAITSKMVGDAARQGDVLALEVMRRTGYMLGIAMANAVSFSSPEAVFLMGGPVKAGEVLLKPLRESFDEHLLFVFKGKVSLRLSELHDNDVAILGAAALSKAI